MIVVSNTSPIINLATIKQLDLLQQLYSHILIPEAVHDEIVVLGAGQPGEVEVKTSIWIESKPLKNQLLVASLRLELDPGEAEAIALSLEMGADLLLIDERKGRIVAARLGTNVGSYPLSP